ncbi:glycosyltransferase family 2 protein [Algirhabdus cladophorae]|uniref:glycosyltransferase family 2 protein n=1 Tax=Algirhabdus cladophorae TaxID=3377108 RepID=UPI003B849F67
MTDVSIVIPMKNEVGNAPDLINALVAECHDVRIEIIAIDDASTDGTDQALRDLQATVPTLRVLQNTKSGGQSAAVHSGVLAAKAAIVCTLDGDGQNPASQVPKLYRPLLADETGLLALVAGQRVDRQDTQSKKLASKLANGLRGWLLNDGTRDTGCGLKGFRRDVFLQMPYFDHMHRYLPALFKRDGWQIELVDVTHRERGSGNSNYSNLNRALVGVYDLIGVAWLIKRRKKAYPKELD